MEKKTTLYFLKNQINFLAIKSDGINLSNDFFFIYIHRQRIELKKHTIEIEK